jgi:hypothetical protein
MRSGPAPEIGCNKLAAADAEPGDELAIDIAGRSPEVVDLV